MKEVVTRDKSITLHSKEYDETYHSVSGAVEEAYKKFVEPALEIVDLRNKDEISILDVGFGLGYNSGAVLDKVLEASLNCRISIAGLEKDPGILLKIKDMHPLIKTYHVIKDLAEQLTPENKGTAKMLEYNKEGIIIRVLLGRAEQLVKHLEPGFDIILHDPFSPKKNPELWTESFFKELRRLIKDNGVLTTFSCARNARENMMKAGFKVRDGPCVGRRAPSTIATPK